MSNAHEVKVKHALDIPLNFISLGQLDDDSYHNDLFNGQWKLTKGSSILALGRKHSILYVTQGSILGDYKIGEERDFIRIMSQEA